MAKKIDMFKASKEMSVRVADFMRVRVYGATLQTRYKKEMSEIEEKIEKTPELLKGSIFADKIDEVISGLVLQKEEISAKYKALREEAEKFVFTDADNAFYKEYKSGNVKEGLLAWGKAYNLDLADTDFLGVLTVGISGLKNANARTIVTSGAKEFTSIRKKGDILKVMYGLLAEKMLAVGTLKPESIPEDVVAYYKKKSK